MFYSQENLFSFVEKMYQQCDLVCDNFQPERESKEQAAGSFTVNGLKIQLRKSKITPTKIGQFVTVWKRSYSGETAPYDIKDKVYFFVIQAETNNNKGQFVFPQSVLVEEGVFSSNGSGGKRGIRVYPSWDKPTSKQAQKTQEWQLKYFIETNSSKFCYDLNRLYTII